jgi:hypothetical protein
VKSEQNQYQRNKHFIRMFTLLKSSKKQDWVNILSGHSARVGSSHVKPAALRGTAFFLVSALCSISLLARAAFTPSSASGVIVCASL